MDDDVVAAQVKMVEAAHERACSAAWVYCQLAGCGLPQREGKSNLSVDELIRSKNWARVVEVIERYGRDDKYDEGVRQAFIRAALRIGGPYSIGDKCGASAHDAAEKACRAGLLSFLVIIFEGVGADALLDLPHVHRFLLDLPPADWDSIEARLHAEFVGTVEQLGAYDKPIVKLPPAGHKPEEIQQPAGVLSAKQISETYNVPLPALNKRLERFRSNNGDGWYETADHRQNEPKYLYNVQRIGSIIEDLRAKNKPLDENCSVRPTNV